ncbi:hypothetical protein UQ35_07645 [Escherichia coli]|nr:hypothetical protein UQ35_07645 [Escherichia coli]
MVNPPERRGISAQVFLLYPFCAGSGADTEFTGRHPAPCKKKNVHANMPLSGGAFFMGKKCPNGFGQ